MQLANQKRMNAKRRTLLPLAASAGLALIASPASAVTLLNPNFDPPTEDTSDNTGTGGIGPISGWSNSGTVGITNTTPFLNQSAHIGTHVAFTRATASISQSVSGFDPSKNYTLTYFVSERGVGLGPQTTSVSLDGGITSYTQPDLIGKTDTFRRIVSGPLSVSGATSTVQISALLGGDRTLLIDSVSISRAVPTVADGGFENPVQPDGNFKQAAGAGGGDLTGSEWTFLGGGGITDNGSVFGPPDAPEGSQAAILQGGTAEFSTTVSGFEAGVTYSLSFEAAGRANGAADFQVWLDGTLLDFGGSNTLTPAAGSYATFTSSEFTTSGGSLTLTFDGTAAGTSFVDDIRFNFVAEAVPEPCTTLFATLGLTGLLLVRRRRTPIGPHQEG